MTPSQDRIHLTVDADADIDIRLALEAARGNVRISISPSCAALLDRSAELLERFAASTVYGLTTGFGPLASYGSDAGAQQEGLIAHLATGTGPRLSYTTVRLMMLDRLFTLGRGHSLASRRLVERLIAVLEQGLWPEVPAFGSVGASGDLTPLAHLALAIAGPGGMRVPGEGARRPAAELLAEGGLEALRYEGRDALALVNGTSASLALIAGAWDDLARLFAWSLPGQAAMIRALDVPTQAYDDTIHRVRVHPGQQRIARSIAALVDQAGPTARSRETGGDHERELQAAYSFRCIPQILGPFLEELCSAADSLDREFAAVTDNPIFDLERFVALHGGNFHGHILARVADGLSLVAAGLGQLLERQIARITDPKLNGGLPPFLSPERVGPHSGFMGAQVSATALSAELSAMARARYALESRSTNGANQDIVSMSTLAGWKLHEIMPRLGELVAIHALVAVQALELSWPPGAEPDDETSTVGLFRSFVRHRSEPLGVDRPLGSDIERLARDLISPAAPAFLRELRLGLAL